MLQENIFISVDLLLFRYENVINSKIRIHLLGRYLKMSLIIINTGLMRMELFLLLT